MFHFIKEDVNPLPEEMEEYNEGPVLLRQLPAVTPSPPRP